VSTFPHCSEQCPDNTTADQGATIATYARNAPNKMWKKKWHKQYVYTLTQLKSLELNEMCSKKHMAIQQRIL
jgi:hypothetical protein